MTPDASTDTKTSKKPKAKASWFLFKDGDHGDGVTPIKEFSEATELQMYLDSLELEELVGAHIIKGVRLPIRKQLRLRV